MLSYYNSQLISQKYYCLHLEFNSLLSILKKKKKKKQIVQVENFVIVLAKAVKFNGLKFL